MTEEDIVDELLSLSEEELEDRIVSLITGQKKQDALLALATVLANVALSMANGDRKAVEILFRSLADATPFADVPESADVPERMN